ncbi:MAG: acyl-[acyl-carrier-protein] desaturase [Candidatus Eremiobacteraeota bacterium]|nr:acyl-[acyl-carrier-protein] desaturase [Candidatus Eremiobacteraeota bacterium]
MIAAPYRLGAPAVAALFDEYSAVADRKPWTSVGATDWSRLRPEKLTEEHASAVAFVTFIEDHLPGYVADYHRIFPVDASVPLDEFVHNRELYRFVVRWALEEDRHAHVLATYQVRAGLASADELRLRLAEEGLKPFSIGYTEPVQVFTYTLIQEKATQLYYQQLAAAVDEPVLKQILTDLARDESRHYGFFARLVETYVRAGGPALLPRIREVLANFRMPLATTLTNYWRWSLRVSDAAGGYDYTDAFASLVQVVRRAADGPAWTGDGELTTFLAQAGTL